MPLTQSNLETGRDSLHVENVGIKLPSGTETRLAYCEPRTSESRTVCVVIAHGAGGPMHTPFIRYFHMGLAEHGFLTVKFNFPYMEAHRRIPDRTNVLEETYREVVEEVRSSRYKPTAIFVGGKSMGGRIASQVAANGVEVNGLFFLGYPLHPPSRMEKLRDQHLYKIRKPMLFVSGTRDNFARKDLLEQVVSKIGPNASIHWIEDGDHSFKRRVASRPEYDPLKEPFTILKDWLLERS